MQIVKNNIFYFAILNKLKIKACPRNDLNFLLGFFSETRDAGLV